MCGAPSLPVPPDLCRGADDFPDIRFAAACVSPLNKRIREPSSHVKTNRGPGTTMTSLGQRDRDMCRNVQVFSRFRADSRLAAVQLRIANVRHDFVRLVAAPFWAREQVTG